MSHPADSPTRSAVSGGSTTTTTATTRRKGRRSQREKIERMVAEGAKNYPAYLKLIYTGDSEQSSEEEGGGAGDVKTEGGALLPRRPTDEEGVEPGWEDAAATAAAAGGGGTTGPQRILSPESDKLLDPGKEKATTPTTDNAGQKDTKNPQNTATKEISEEMDNRQLSNHRKQQDDNQRNNNEEKWKIELFQLQDDIISLKSMLNGKLQIAADLKQKLGISSPIAEFKHSFFSFKESGTFLRTNTDAVLKSLGSYASRKMGTIRNSVVFKSVEEKVAKVKSRSMGHIRSKLNRRMSVSKSESNVADLKSNERHSISSIEEEEVLDSTPPTPPPPPPINC